MKKALLFALFLAGCASLPASPPKFYESFKDVVLQSLAAQDAQGCYMNLLSVNPDGTVTVQVGCENQPYECTMTADEEVYTVDRCVPRPQTKGV